MTEAVPLSLREEQRSLTRRRLVDAACTTFQAHGYEAASIGDIATAAGVHRATFYLHFADKRAVFTAAVEHSTGAVAPYWVGLGAALQDGTAGAVRQWLDRAMGWWDDSAAFQPVMREGQAIDRAMAVARRIIIEELAGTLTTADLAGFPADQRDRVRQKIVLLMLQLDVAWYQWHVNATYDVDRAELLDTLCSLWCSTLGLSQDPHPPG